jgi:MoxR-like ATPase
MLELRNRLLTEVRKVVVGQDHVVDGLLVALAARGHVLLEGPPGTAKTLLANAFARALGLTFRRAQFTPDLLPTDLTGTMTLVGGALGELSFRAGPVFTNVLLADEINRTPPKTQAALLEAMGEAQVTVDGTTRPLPDPFFVVATQNPIEYEGTYPLPEAQLDRFTLKLDVAAPGREDELVMLRLRHRGVTPATLDDIVGIAGADGADGSRRMLDELRAAVDATTVTDAVAGYVVDIVRATRSLPAVALGGSPRAAVQLLAASKSYARLRDRDFVTPDDVATMAPPVLRHRLVLRPEAELERYRPDELVAAAMQTVTVPR